MQQGRDWTDAWAIAEQNKNRLVVEAQENFGTLIVDPMRLRQT
jgi:hypothetical protein